jgi:hypothetical protein
MVETSDRVTALEEMMASSNASKVDQTKAMEIVFKNQAEDLMELNSRASRQRRDLEIDRRARKLLDTKIEGLVTRVENMEDERVDLAGTIARLQVWSKPWSFMTSVLIIFLVRGQLSSWTNVSLPGCAVGQFRSIAVVARVRGCR